MDTDELSSETYKAILIEAEKFNHDLTLQFGLISYSCNNEKQYLLKAKDLINHIQQLDKPGLAEIFFDAIPNKESLHLTLNKILDNISEVEKIPEINRHYDF